MKNHEEESYLILLKNIIDNGYRRESRSGATRSIFGTRLRFSLEGGKIPILTTKKIFVRGMIEELIFFIAGKTQTKELEAKGVNIWKGNTSREFLDKRGLVDYDEGEMGPLYGAAWRSFGKREGYAGIDQLQNCIDLIRTDPNSRRMMVSAYNPTVSHLTVLDPCHTFFQFYVRGDVLDCQWYQRSADAFLGLPINIGSYALLTHLVAKITDLQPGILTFIGGDTHAYSNHTDQINEQIYRDSYPFPTINICKEIQELGDIVSMSAADFELIGYRHHDAIRAPMSA